MALFNLKNLGGNGNTYTVMTKCRNCSTIFELKVIKGVTVQEFFQTGQARCNNCGCNELSIKSGQQQSRKVKKLW